MQTWIECCLIVELTGDLDGIQLETSSTRRPSFLIKLYYESKFAGRLILDVLFVGKLLKSDLFGWTVVRIFRLLLEFFLESFFVTSCINLAKIPTIFQYFILLENTFEFIYSHVRSTCTKTLDFIFLKRHQYTTRLPKKLQTMTQN